jgi:hypothetical protein
MSAVVAVLSLVLAGSGEEPLRDNGLLVEEAYNQEPGTLQHAGTFERHGGGAWEFRFTEEIPVAGLAHQLAVSWGALSGEDGGGAGVADVDVAWRWQATGDEEAAVAIAPELALTLPVGDASKGRGEGGVVAEVELPASFAFAERFLTHVNLGLSWGPAVRASDGGFGPLVGVRLGQSLVWNVHPRLDLFTEVLWERSRIDPSGGPAQSETSFRVSPGMRGGGHLGPVEVVAGVAAPIGVGPSRGDNAVLLYLSFEHSLGRGESARARDP